MRSNRSKSKHDAEVRRTANQLLKQGFDVKADLKGFSQPQTFAGYRPDVVATKGLQRRIIEVETKDSVNSTRDIKQQQAFKQVASRAKNTKFIRKVTE